MVGSGVEGVPASVTPVVVSVLLVKLAGIFVEIIAVEVCSAGWVFDGKYNQFHASHIVETRVANPSNI